MCGFAGLIDLNRVKSNNELVEISNKINNTISYRGPDDHGVWVDQESGVALGHRRLSIIDLSSAGSQPMSSYSGRYIIAFNGEVYNYEELRKNLQRKSFKSSSDTEVVLATIEEKGLFTAVSEFIGMFAFSLWDKKDKKLYLVRDRVGIKPLYYSHYKGYFCWGSELKPLLETGFVEKDIDRNSLGEFFQKGYISAPKSIFKNVKKLESGCILEFSLDENKYTIQNYWDVSSYSGADVKFKGSESDAIEHLEELINDAIKIRMISDVPLGAFLSGGIDSSLVVASMQRLSAKPIKTFSIGFENSQFNEAKHAKDVANYLNTNHHELYITEKDAIDVIPDLPFIWDEPFADSSQIPTYIVSKMTKEYVTVSLSGDGGDELFGGYSRYFTSNRVWQKIKNTSGVKKKLARTLIENTPKGIIDNFYSLIEKALPQDLKFKHKPSSKITAILNLLNSNNFSEVYENVLFPFNHLNPVKECDIAKLELNNMNKDCHFTQMMLHDFIDYLPNDVLTKVDRASMSNSLEARVPLLDHRIVEFAYNLPIDFKVKNGVSKFPLKEILYKKLPKSMMDRPKMGFSVPISSWLRSDLKEWAFDLLSERELNKHGLLKNKLILDALNDHVSEVSDMQVYLWRALIFQSWYKKWFN